MRHFCNNNEKIKIGESVMYFIGDKEQTSRKLRQKWSGPWKVAKRLQDNAYELTDGGKRQSPAHVERMKKYFAKEYWSLKKYNKMIEQGELKDELEMVNEQEKKDDMNES